MSVDRNDQERWHALMDTLSDHWIELPDDQVRQEFGHQAMTTHGRVRELIRQAVGEGVQTPYEASKAALIAEKEGSYRPSIPETPEQRRSLLASILSGDHPWSSASTLAFRDLSDPGKLTDEEISGILEDMADLYDENDG